MNAYLFPIGEERVQRNIKEAFRHWISWKGGSYSRDEALDLYLDALQLRSTGLLPSSLQWPNRVQGTTSSQFQTNYLSPSSFINPHSSYYSYR